MLAMLSCRGVLVVCLARGEEGEREGDCSGDGGGGGGGGGATTTEQNKTRKRQKTI